MFIFWFAMSAFAAVLTTTGSNGALPDIDQIDGYPIEEVHLRTMDGVHVAAWYLPADGEKAVVLVPGIGGNRNAMRSRAALYARLGIATILPDFRGTGESDPAVVSMGWHERHDIEAAYRYLLSRGYSRIGAHGISMGAAAICYSFQEIDDFSWVVLESSYDTIDNALDNRLAMGGISGPLIVLTQPMRWFSKLRAGAGPDELRPVDHIRLCTSPTLVMAGDSERELPVSETQSLFEACGADNKRLHFFEGAGHDNFYGGRYAEEYLSQVEGFLAANEIIADVSVR